MVRLGRGHGAALREVWLTSVVGGIAVFGNLVSAVQILSGRFLFQFGGGDPRLPLVQLPQLLQGDVRAGHTYTVADLAPGVRVLCASPSVVAAGTIAVAVILLAGVLSQIAAGRAFGSPVRRRIALLSTVLIGGGLLQGLLDTAAIAAVVASVDQVAVQGIGTNLPNWPWALIIVGVVVSALGAAFAEGARLKDDIAGVI